MMAEAAAYNIDRGAQIIDINMGCPAKKVCNKWAGSALMRNEALALEIVEAVVAVCEPRGVPVTLKMRTGWCAGQRNALSLAGAAQSADNVEPMALVCSVHRVEQVDLGLRQPARQFRPLSRADSANDVAEELPDLGWPPSGHMGT